MVDDSIWSGGPGSKLDGRRRIATRASRGGATVAPLDRPGLATGASIAPVRTALAVAAVLLVLIAGAAPATPDIRFAERARALGIDHHPTCGGRGGELELLVESSGAGCALFDPDADGDLDLLLLDGATLEGVLHGEEAPPDRLFRNDGPGGSPPFVDVTASAGLSRPGWSQGAQAADLDGDGDPDLHVTRFGPDVLYQNAGDGSFRDVGVRAGIDAGGWSTASAAGDLDGDGDLDLYVARYVALDATDAPRLGPSAGCTWRGVAAPCGPDDIEPLSDRLYLNDGSGRFTDAGEASGITAVPAIPATDVRLVDLDLDGDLDILVAGDGTPNRLFVNDGAAGFAERGLLQGFAFDPSGRPQHTGALAVADWNDDGRVDVLATGAGGEADILYENRAGGQLVPGVAGARHAYWTRAARTAAAHFADLDHDGDLDLIAVRGERFPEADASGTGTRFAQADRLFENRDGVFEPLTETGTPMDAAAVSRGLAVGDLDGDTDLDIVVTRLRQPPLVLVNELDAGGDVAGALLLRLHDGAGVHGARIDAELGGRRVTRYAATMGGRSQSDARVHLGAGWVDSIEAVRVHWADGRVDSLGALPARAEITVRRGAGVVGRRWLGGGLR